MGLILFSDGRVEVYDVVIAVGYAVVSDERKEGVIVGRTVLTAVGGVVVAGVGAGA